MKKLTKLMSLFLVFALTLSCIPAAFAAEVDDAVINPDAACSLTVFKFDWTNAVKDGVWNQDSFISTGWHESYVEETLGGAIRKGDANSSADHALGNGQTSNGYAIAGVEFTSLKVADIAAFTESANDGHEDYNLTQVLYGFDKTAAAALLTAIGLENGKDAYANAAATDKLDSSKYYYTSDTLNKALADVDGHNLLLGLNDLNYLQKQGINGPIWALIALDAGNYPDPDGGDVTREALIRVILDAQLEDGGWALSGENADPDMTGMALQALAPYYDRSQAVQNAVDGAVALLSAMQDGNGGYSGADGASCESIAQVIVALTALGIDPATDTRFVKNGISILDALMQYAVSDGGFRHDLTGERDGMATEQGYCALTAYDRFMRAKTALYMMTDVIDLGGDTVPEPVDSRPADTGSAEMDAEGGFPWEMVLTVLGIGAGVTAAAVWRKRIRQANSGT